MSIVQVRMQDGTLSQIDALQKRVHAPSRSDAIRRAIELSDAVTKAIQNGGKIIIESKEGKKMQVLVPGIEQGDEDISR